MFVCLNKLVTFLILGLQWVKVVQDFFCSFGLNLVDYVLYLSF